MWDRSQSRFYKLREEYPKHFHPMTRSRDKNKYFISFLRSTDLYIFINIHSYLLMLEAYLVFLKITNAKSSN